MRIFANVKSWEDGYGADWYSELSLEPIFENNLFLDTEEKVFNASAYEDWKPYNGKHQEEVGYIDSKTGKFINEDTDLVWDIIKDFKRAVLYRIYKEGELIDTEIVEEEW